LTEQGAVTRGSGETHARRSGGDGAPPGGTKTSRKELADGARYPPTRRISRQKRGPGAVRHRDGAPRGAGVPSQGMPRTRKVRRRKGRLAALHPSGVGRRKEAWPRGSGEDGRPPRASKNRGD